MPATISYYGKPGTQDVWAVSGSLGLNENDLPKGYVKLQTAKPTDDDKAFWTISLDGSWEYPRDNDIIKAERQRRIMEAWPTEKQMEAHSDAALGDATKLNELLFFLKKIKEDLPYHEQTLKYE